MSRIDKAIHEIHHIDYTASKDMWLNNIHPFSKLLVTVMYIVFVISFDKYDITGIFSMCLYPFVIMLIADISPKMCLNRMKAVFLVICFVGIANPFLDTNILYTVFGIRISGGVISMITLMLKGILAVTASYILIITTTIENICYALRCVHVPKMYVTIIMLIYRYIIVLLKETERITQAYSLRAPNQKGINYKAWGTLAGQLLLRSMDRAESVYESMTLRGYDGDFLKGRKKKLDVTSIVYMLVCAAIIVILRRFAVFEIIGGMFV